MTLLLQYNSSNSSQLILLGNSEALVYIAAQLWSALSAHSTLLCISTGLSISSSFTPNSSLLRHDHTEFLFDHLRIHYTLLQEITYIWYKRTSKISKLLCCPCTTHVLHGLITYNVHLWYMNNLFEMFNSPLKVLNVNYEIKY